MSVLENGMLVQHASLGVGRVVALEPNAVHVFFANGDARFATKLRLPMALPLLKPALVPNAWLSGLPGFTLDAKTGRYGIGGTAWLSHGDAVERFLAVFPDGFEDAGYLADGAGKRERVSHWRRAHATYAETLGGGKGELLLAAGDLGELAERALEVERHDRSLQRDLDKVSFQGALHDVEASRPYFAALFELLAGEGPNQSRFEALAAAVAAMMPDAAPEARWPIVTLVPFVARPDLHLQLRPRVACLAAQRLALELAYEASPTWRTYSALLSSAGGLLERLRPLGARDHVDVESFLQVVTTKPPRPKAPKARLRLVTGPRLVR